VPASSGTTYTATTPAIPASTTATMKDAVVGPPATTHDPQLTILPTDVNPCVGSAAVPWGSIIRA
jgi:hypothetical protein